MPQPGSQALAWSCPCDIILFGGRRGTSKSDAAIGRQIKGAQDHKHNWNGIIFRRRYDDLAEMRRRWDQLIREGLPAERIGGDRQMNTIRFTNGAKVTLAAVQRFDQLDDYVGQQYTEACIEECTKFPFFQRMVNTLLGSMRSAAGVKCAIFCTGNPGGPGHAQVKEFFRIYRNPTGSPFTLDNSTQTVVYIEGRLEENKKLVDNDPQYVQRLKSISDPILRKAWLEGDWNVEIGLAFTFIEKYHVLEGDPLIPGDATIFTTYDYGFGAPFSQGWWFVDNDGRLHRFAEWYGCTGVPGEGLRLTDEQVAEGIIEREKRLGLTGHKIVRFGSQDCFSKKPDYKGGGQGEATAEIFAKYGLVMQPADNDRAQKIRRFRERLRIKTDEQGNMIERPMLVTYRTCKDFIRTIPAIPLDETNIEDVDADSEDHCYDEAAQICLMRDLKGVSKKPGGRLEKAGV